MRCRAWLLLAALLQGILASEEVGTDPLTNLRPDNVTGLIYYLYRWTGSYYNGSTTIRLQPQDNIQSSTCVGQGPIVVSFNSSLLAVTQTNGYLLQENPTGANPLAFNLKLWLEGLNLLPSENMNDGSTEDIQEISSVQMNTKDRPDDPTAAPPWKLVASHDAALTYSFQGYHNPNVSAQALRFNNTQCASLPLALYNGTLLGNQSSVLSNLSVTTEPRVRGIFSNESASLEIKGIYQGYSESGSALGGNVTIVFNGTIDEARSDRLMSNTLGSAPVWESTLGYTKTLMGETPVVHVGAGNVLGVGWGLRACVLGLVVFWGL
ncbi:hypothetical protein BU23DRAFT_603389 [Bimuria novae-zelandiae CBS 107.79]|uniref:Uncharacterized protein n=1 Tax=Bimuria novae-zelandiae CBS 107.79 TaxID=1447943 RepID=A0A6A5URL6_9PLEO|nr:hypothetical protein BU23DRAFT_603389 [Bimuria novae-zelandiae CBS 107.79]